MNNTTWDSRVCPDLTFIKIRMSLNHSSGMNVPSLYRRPFLTVFQCDLVFPYLLNGFSKYMISVRSNWQSYWGERQTVWEHPCATAVGFWSFKLLYWKYKNNSKLLSPIEKWLCFLSQPHLLVSVMVTQKCCVVL